VNPGSDSLLAVTVGGAAVFFHTAIPAFGVAENTAAVETRCIASRNKAAVPDAEKNERSPTRVATQGLKALLMVNG
jgi:hypothetical protein